MQQQQLVSPINGNHVSSSASTKASDRQIPSSPSLGDYIGLYPSVFSPEQAPPRRSLSPSSGSNEVGPTGERLYLARLALQYQDLADRYDLCLSHLRRAGSEAAALSRENARLRAANDELVRRLSLFAGIISGGIATSPPPPTIADEFRRLRVGGDPASGFERRGWADRPALPKSISIRSKEYLKLNRV